MGKPFRGRLSRRDTILRNNAIDRFYAAGAGVEPQFQVPVPAKRARIRRPSDDQPVAPLEKDIQKAIIEAIELRRDVVFVGRFNRGQAVATDTHGETRYTPFNSVPGFPDIHGLLVGGRAFYIEVKRPPPHYRKPDDAQQRFLDEARVGGACAGVACSVDEAMALLP
jgi:hypothetical protein